MKHFALLALVCLACTPYGRALTMPLVVEIQSESWWARSTDIYCENGFLLARIHGLEFNKSVLTSAHLPPTCTMVEARVKFLGQEDWWLPLTHVAPGDTLVVRIPPTRDGT